MTRTEEEIEKDILKHFVASFDSTIASVSVKHRGKVIKEIGTKKRKR